MSCSGIYLHLGLARIKIRVTLGSSLLTTSSICNAMKLAPRSDLVRSKTSRCSKMYVLLDICVGKERAHKYLGERWLVVRYLFLVLQSDCAFFQFDVSVRTSVLLRNRYPDFKAQMQLPTSHGCVNNGD